MLILSLEEGRSICKHVKALMEIFEELAIIEDAVSEEDRVVHLLASLPKSYAMLMSLEAQENVPRWDVVTECLLHEEDGGAQYFLTFIDHKSRYLWLYFSKQKIKF